MMFTLLLLPVLAAAQVTFVQVNSNSATVYTNKVAVPFTAAQAVGNLNVVVVGWSDTSSTVATVADSNGNTYALAAGTVSTALPAPGSSQAIYYAKNIKAGANMVTVTFNQDTAVQDVRIVEYSGLDVTNPLDISVGSSGTTTPADSGAATTNSANDLIFGAGTITTGFADHGPGFVTELLNGFGDIVEDEVVNATGTYHATAIPTTGGWVMQMAAFRQAGQTPPTFSAPAITSLSTASSPEAGGIPLTITGTNFEPGAIVLFSNTGGTTAAGVNCSVTLLTAPNATIACVTPSFPTGSADITVANVDGQTSAASAFTFTASTPFATAASPGIAPGTGSTNGGTAVTISGSDFAAGAKVTVGGVPADKVSVVNVNSIQAKLPAGSAGSAAVVVTNPSGTQGTLPGGYTYATAAGISFVQANSAQPTSPATTAMITYAIAQTAGNLNVAIIGWADATTTVQSVTDSAGNTYNLAFNATVGAGLSQAIYYAKNIIAAASNTVTVTFSAAAASPDVRVLEYSGLDPVTPLDTAGGNTGTGTALDSGPITTTNASDLIIGAGKTVGGAVATSGPAFITVNVTPDGDNVEHLVGPPVGIIDATAIQNASTAWVMQAVAFLEAPIPDFSVSVSPPGTASVAAGNPATYTISVSGLNGFTGVVTLTCSAGLPTGASCAFVPPSVTPSGTPVSSTLTLATSATTPAATSTVTVTGTSGLLTHDTTVGLTVTPAPDFTIAATALSPATISAGAAATSTITIAPANGFNGSVSLTCNSIAPVVTPPPTCSFNPASVAGGSGTSTLTVSSSTTTPTGLFNVTVSGTSGSLSHTAPVSFTVTAAQAADFTVAATALSPASISPGGTATSTITIAPTNGFTGAVTLTCSSITPAATRAPACSFNPSSVANGSGTSTLTVSTTAATSASIASQSGGVFYAIWLPIVGLTLLGTGFNPRKKKLWGFLLGCLLFSGLIFMAACGGSSSSGGGGGGHPGTPAGTYTLTVTGTAPTGSPAHSTNVTLTVN